MERALIEEIRPHAPGDAAEPELSVILPTEGFELARETIEVLRAQTARERVELLLATSAPALTPPERELLGGFHSARVVRRDPSENVASARAACVRLARAPVVAMAETHCFPDPDWAEALIERHRGPWAAVGPEIHNDNPERAVSWANLFVDYSPWVAPRPAGPVDDLPGHNSSYKRDLLLEYGDELKRMMESESLLHWDLRARGHQLYLESRARVRHRNITRPWHAMFEHFLNGRCFGGRRSGNWHPLRRVVYALGSPLIPLIRARRILTELKRSGRSILPAALPMLAGSLLAHGLGEMTGYLTGPGDSAAGMIPYELDRDAYVTELDGTGRAGAST